MIAEQKFYLLQTLIDESKRNRDTNNLINNVKNLNLNIEGESNFMRLNCSFVEVDGSSVHFTYRSYDPSGPFQNLPDINKIRLELRSNGSLIKEYYKEFED